MMKFEEWKAKYYPTTARHASRLSLVQAVAHSLRKWQGARPAALASHGLALDPAFADEIVPDEPIVPHAPALFVYSSETCSLCLRFSTPTDIMCDKCPLDRYTHGCARGGAYGVFLDTGDPEPMIRALEQTLADVAVCELEAGERKRAFVKRNVEAGRKKQ